MPPDVTELLTAWGRGDPGALNELIPVIEDQLRTLAHRCMLGERGGHPLQTTALISEAYLRLIDIQRVNWQDRSHFFAVCARVMRRVLVDTARMRRAQKRGRGEAHEPLDEGLRGADSNREDVVAIDQALEALAAIDPRKAHVVELRFFGGLTVDEAAEVLEISPETVMRDWKLARVWLMRRLTLNPGSADAS